MKKKRILIVDDEEAFGQMVKLNLEETGEYEVRIELKGAQALAATRAFKPDLILLDIIMPDVDGGEICQRIQSDEGLKDIPIVFLTAIINEKELGSQGSIIGGHPFLAKPVSKKKLIDCIEKNIRK